MLRPDSWRPGRFTASSTPIGTRASIGLVGDAAHAMLPFQAQGAAMGIEDAAVLAPLLMANADPESAFASYQPTSAGSACPARCAACPLPTAWSSTCPGRFGYGRDLVVFMQGPMAHLKRLAWLYGYDPAPDPEPTIAAAGPTDTAAQIACGTGRNAAFTEWL